MKLSKNWLFGFLGLSVVCILIGLSTPTSEAAGKRKRVNCQCESAAPAALNGIGCNPTITITDCQYTAMGIIEVGWTFVCNLGRGLSTECTVTEVQLLYEWNANTQSWVEVVGWTMNQTLYCGGTMSYLGPAGIPVSSYGHGEYYFGVGFYNGSTLIAVDTTTFFQ